MPNCPGPADGNAYVTGNVRNWAFCRMPGQCTRCPLAWAMCGKASNSSTLPASVGNLAEYPGNLQNAQSVGQCPQDIKGATGTPVLCCRASSATATIVA